MEILPVTGLGEIGPGDDLAALISSAFALRDSDIVVIAQKAVSKAEGRLVAVSSGDGARRAARRQARRIVRETPQHLIVETAHGFVCANAGVDSSNVPEGFVLLLPKDPDASAERIRKSLETAAAPVAVVISDTFGRPWRLGLTDVAIGVAGMACLRDHRGQTDSHGRELRITQMAQADEIAGAAELVMGKTAGVPAAIVRGYEWTPAPGRARDLVRPASEDLFR